MVAELRVCFEDFKSSSSIWINEWQSEILGKCLVPDLFWLTLRRSWKKLIQAVLSTVDSFQSDSLDSGISILTVYFTISAKVKAELFKNRVIKNVSVEESYLARLTVRMAQFDKWQSGTVMLARPLGQRFFGTLMFVGPESKWKKTKTSRGVLGEFFARWKIKDFCGLVYFTGGALRRYRWLEFWAC